MLYGKKIPVLGLTNRKSPSILATTGSEYRFFHGIFRTNFPVKYITHFIIEY